MEGPFYTVDEICPDTKNWKARVRVLKKMEPKTSQNSPIMFQNLILGDMAHNTVDAVIFRKNIDLFKDTLEAGNVYAVKDAIVKDPLKYRNPLVTCKYQWIFNKGTSVLPENADVVPNYGLQLNIIRSRDFKKHLGTDSLISAACVIIARREPRCINAKGQGKMIYEYAAVDKDLYPFVITIWEKSIPEETLRLFDSVENRPAMLFLNFGIVPYYGACLSSNAQSMVFDRSDHETTADLEIWKSKNEKAIDSLVQAGGFFQKNVMCSPQQLHQVTSITNVLQTKEKNILMSKFKEG